MRYSWVLPLYNILYCSLPEIVGPQPIASTPYRWIAPIDETLTVIVVASMAASADIVVG